MDNLLQLQYLQSLHQNHHMSFWYQGDVYLVHEIGEDSVNETVTDLDSAFIIGTASNGECIQIRNPEHARFFIFDDIGWSEVEYPAVPN